MDARIKKHQFAIYLDKSTTSTPEWVRLEKATDFSRSLSPETESRDYIADERPSTVLKQYSPQESFTIDCYKGNADFDLLYSLYKNLATGTDAEKKLLIVSKFDEVEVEGVESTCYYAELMTATIAINEMNVTDSTLSVDIYENGNKTDGYVTYSESVPTFTANA